MFETLSATDVSALRGLVRQVGALPAAPDDAARIDQLETLERLKSAACATQARIVEQMESDRAAAEGGARAGTRAGAAIRHRSLGAQLGLARHESPHRGRQLLGLALALLRDLPQTYAALALGDLSEHRARIIATESRDLARHDRLRLDAELAARPGGLAHLGDRALHHATRRLVLRLDAAGAIRRRQAAHTRRHVTSRRLPDGMAMITAVVSDLHHAAIMNSLQARASTELAAGRAGGEGGGDRSRAQVVADVLVARLTGQITALATPVRVDLVISAEALLGGSDEPAEILGHGPIPAAVARTMALTSPAHQTRIRRLFRFEDTDGLVALESNSRTFDHLLAEAIRIRDQHCRTPWCNAPIRHLDHVTGVAAGGRTTEDNGQGLCESCNYTKETLGWAQTRPPSPFGTHIVEITTPTGHRHRSRAPGLLDRPSRHGSRLELYLADLTLIA